MRKIKTIGIIFLLLLIAKVGWDWYYASEQCPQGNYHIAPLTVDNWHIHADLDPEDRPPEETLNQYRNASQNGTHLPPLYCW